MSYNTIEIIIFTLLLYFLTWIAVKFNMLNLSTHRKIWNLLLALSFVVSGMLGIILAILLDAQASIGWYADMLWMHVEFGIAMAIIAFFHGLWHLKYYLRIFKNK